MIFDEMASAYFARHGIAGTLAARYAASLGGPPDSLILGTRLRVPAPYAALANGNVTLQLKVPETANISIFSTLNDRWDVMADLQYTGWSSIQQLQIVRSTGVVLNTLPENFRNTWRGSFGVNYRWDDKWMLRGGIAYDQSPVNNTDRSPRLPDNNRTWIAFGMQYKVSKAGVIDWGYAHEFIKDARVTVPVPGAASCVPAGTCCSTPARSRSIRPRRSPRRWNAKASSRARARSSR